MIKMLKVRWNIEAAMQNSFNFNYITITPNDKHNSVGWWEGSGTGAAHGASPTTVD